MPKLNSGPRTGLDLDAALAKWAEPQLWARVKAVEDAKEPNSPDRRPEAIAAYDIRHNAWEAARNAAESDLIEELKVGDVVASAIEVLPGGGVVGRRVIEPSLWDVLLIDRREGYIFKLAEWRGEPVIYKAPEFFDRTEIPRNIQVIPAWLAYGGQVIEGSPELFREEGESFSHSEDYQHITINNVPFRLGPLQAKAVAEMHDALRSGNSWVNGKQILEKIGSQSTKMIDIFKSKDGWDEYLMESDGAGGYRLRING